MSEHTDSFKDLLAGSQTRIIVTGLCLGAGLGALGAEFSNQIFEYDPHSPPELFAAIGSAALGIAYNRLARTSPDAK
jgi:H+/Cl- antiporter ClcA